MSKENPFSPAFPVNPKYFVNRIEVIDSFKRAFDRSTKTETPTPDNIAILGDWGIGKTSVLRKFEAMALEEFRERKIREKSPATVFRDALIDLWKILEKSGVDTALLMLDDLHYLADRYPDGLYDLRGVFQGLPKHGCNFILCTTGKKELFSNIRELAEPLTRFFNIKHTLDFFGLEETKNAILKPIELSGLDLTIEDEVITKIHTLTVGHPFFIHFIMRELVSLKGNRVTLNYFEENYKLIEKTIEREKFEVDFSIASDKEKKLLLAMAELPDRFSPSGIKIKNARTQLRFLLRKNLIIKHDRGEYSLYHPLFKEYLRHAD